MPGQDTAVEIRRGAAEPAPLGVHLRLLNGMRHPANWIQLIRFSVVGASGYVVNLLIFALCVHLAAIDYRAAYALAWLVAVANNFVLNRRFTFDARGGQIHFQALRFFLVSLLAAGFGLVVLMGLVEGAGMAKVPAQALAVAASTPLNFLGNKLWSFREA